MFGLGADRREGIFDCRTEDPDEVCGRKSVNRRSQNEERRGMGFQSCLVCHTEVVVGQSV